MSRGELDEAEKMHRQSLALNQELGRRGGMANQNFNLGILHQSRGELDKACGCWKQAQTLFRDVGMKPELQTTEKLMHDAGCVED